jgi:hypothetical protein
VSSLQVRVAHDAHLTTVVGTAPTAGRLTGRRRSPQPDGGIAEQEDQREGGIGSHGEGERPDHRQEGRAAPDGDQASAILVRACSWDCCI